MRNKAILGMIVLFIATGQGFGITHFNDGGTYNYDSSYPVDIVYVDYESPGMYTTVNLLNGGNIHKFFAYQNGQINILGGSVILYLVANDNSQVTMTDGSAGSMETNGSSQVTISGGTVLSGLYAQDNSQVTMSGGIMDEVVVKNSGLINWSGGIIERDIQLEATAILRIDGSDFAIDGIPYDFGEIKSVLGGSQSQEPPRTLSGILANGDIINNQFRIGDNASIVIPEPSAPPTANINSPYTIYVGDTLILDANGSTDPDGDIVSYMWDLDDDGIFETDADNQQFWGVNYSYLESLSFLINYEYTIHLKVTDSEGQSDIAESTLIIIPKPAVKIVVDIKPGSCPNPINTKSSGVLPVAILGSVDINVFNIDPTSIRLAGVEPLRSGYEDVAAYLLDSNDCNCTETGPDSLIDLILKFETQAIVAAIGDVNDGDIVILELTGVLYDPIPFETPIAGTDCILIKGKHRKPNKADINKDGVVNGLDFAIIAGNWLDGITRTD